MFATAENNLGRLWSRGDPQQQNAAKELFKRSIETYQQLLSESATPDILRRLAQTHIAMSDAIESQSESAGDDGDPGKRHHLHNAKLAFEILADQDLLTAADRLDWASTLVALSRLDENDAESDLVKKLLQQIDESELSPAQRKRLRAVRGGASL